MKHFTFSLLIVLLAIGSLWSQQIPIFNNYVFNPIMYNPAAAGISDYGNLNLIHRSQWIEVPDGPVTNGLTFDMPFKDANIGIGATLFTDNTHIINRFSGSMVYAYHLPFNPDKDHRLSIGASIGVLSQRFNILDASVNEINDPALLDADGTGTTIDLSAGVIYTNKDFSAGIAIPQIAGNNISYNGTNTQSNEFDLTQHLLATLSYNFKFGVDNIFQVQPVTMMRYVQNLPIQIDGQVITTWRNRVWGGVGYRSTDAAGHILATVGFRIKDQFSLTYSFENSLESADATSLGTTHEVLVGFRFGRNKKTIDQLDEELKALNRRVEEDAAFVDTLAFNLQEMILENADAIDQVNDRIDTLELDREQIIQYIDTSKSVTADVNLSYKKLGSVQFDQNSYQLDETATANLDQVVQLVNSSRNVVTIYLQGNASEEGDADYNFILSTRRAVSVKNYLKQKGINQDQIILIPYGAENPVTDNQDTESERSQNRRVDIFIISE